MTLLYVGLQDLYPKFGEEWGEDDSSDFVNRLGKNLEIIGQLDEMQRAEVLKRAKGAGFIRWHVLIANDGSSFDSNYRTDSNASFIMIFGLWERVPETHTLVLDMKDLSVLVRCFGADLEQLQKLPRPRLHTVSSRLDHAAFVNGISVLECSQDNDVSAMENTGPGDSQPTLFLSPQSPGDPPHSIRDASFTLDNSQKWNSYQSLGDSIDFNVETSPLPPANTSSERAPLVTKTRSAATIYTFGNFASPRSMVKKSYPTLGEHHNLRSKENTMREAHHPLSNADENASSHLTPPSYDNEVSNLAVQTNSPKSSFIMTSKTESIHKPISTNEGYVRVPMALHPAQVQGLKRLLFACEPTLNENRFQDILRVSAYSIISEDLEESLRPLFDHWNTHKIIELSALGLPLQWRGISAAANYLRLLDSDGKSSIATRLGQVLLYLNYEELCRNQNKLTRRNSLKADKSDILRYILEEYQNNPLAIKGEGEQVCRDRITGYHLRRGRWWWRIASTLGIGILLLGNTYLVKDMCNRKFTDAQVRAFVTYSLKAQLGSRFVFESTESLVKCLIFGHVSCDLYAVLFNEDAGILGPGELLRVQYEDKKALLTQLTRDYWEAPDIVQNARQKMTNYLGWESDK